MKLSKNFDLKEFTRSETATKLQIANMPNIEQIINLVRLCDYCMQKIRDHYNRQIIITSGFRSLTLNSAVGSKMSSQHTKGEACDFYVDGYSKHDVFCWCKNNLKYDQLIFENTKDKGCWIHISYNHYKNRNQALVFDGKEYKVV